MGRKRGGKVMGGERVSQGSYLAFRAGRGFAGRPALPVPDGVDKGGRGSHSRVGPLFMHGGDQFIGDCGVLKDAS